MFGEFFGNLFSTKPKSIFTMTFGSFGEKIYWVSNKKLDHFFTANFSPSSISSTNIKILLNNRIVGAVQSLNITETKKSIKGTINRIRLDNLFRNQILQKPLKILIEEIDLLGNYRNLTIIDDAYIECYTYSYKADNLLLLLESVEFRAKKMQSIIFKRY